MATMVGTREGSRLPQHMEALQQAHATRLRLAGIKVRLREGRIGIAEALEHPDAGPAELLAFLCVAPRVRRVTALRVIRAAERWLVVGRLPENKRVGDLNGAQVRALRVALAERNLTG